MSGNVVVVENINKVYQLGDMAVPVLKDVYLAIKKKEFVAIMGPSGSGKSSLLNLIGCLDRPSTGKIFIDDTDTSNLSDDELAKIRGRKIGFVFQNFNLLARLNALRNVELPMIYQEIPKQKRIERAKVLLRDVGLEDRILHRPTELSGGERQRVSIARALANEPSIILADEPTGNLDTKARDQIMKIFKNLHDQGRSIILVTHDIRTAQYADRTIRIEDGKIVNS
ncbi:MAG: ABC transporter ATP-binding protein [Candidatus Methanoperedens sp.]|nr:ABC transporter ATP-binding protein [Candidatus Methanoperedens sp.]